MKNILILFFLFSLLVKPVFSQSKQDRENNEDSRNLSVGLIVGSHTQRLESGNNHLANLTSYNVGFKVGYEISEPIYLKTGINGLSTVSIDGISYDSYIIPLTLGTDLNALNSLFNASSYNSNINLMAEIGFYYKGIYDFKNASSLAYSSHNVYGFQAGFSVKYDLSKAMFTKIGFRINNDTDDIIKGSGNNIRVENSYGFEFGFGFKF